MRLPKAAYNWALKHLLREGDSDLFPLPPEFLALKFSWKTVVIDLASLDLSTYRWRGGRRFVVPKDILAFRHGTQLDPLDSIVLAAMVKKLGPRLERHRVPAAEERVFAYRFDPTTDGRFYGQDTGWHEFWKSSRQRATESACTHVLLADISDFYNQVYHHVVENQLREAGIPETEYNVLKRFMSTYSETVSRGVPIGPHAVHLLAELSLHPADESLIAKGYTFCRYVDDFHVFCSSEENAMGALYDLANTLDEQQRLILEKRKTYILPATEFIALADSMLVNRPLNAEESQIIRTINRYTKSDPYRHISMRDVSDADLALLSAEILCSLFNLYLSTTPVNYPRIGWLLRRLRQVGAPGAVDYVLDNLQAFAPVLGDAARYLTASIPNYTADHVALGEKIVSALALPVLARSAYLQIVLLDVLAQLPSLDHAADVTAQYPDAEPAVRREILRVAGANKLGSWLREHKSEFRTADPWIRRAFLFAVPSLPGDEGEHWLRSIKGSLTPLERLIVLFTRRGQRDLKLGTTSLI